MTLNRFTVIIPTRNRSRTLKWCLKTCVEQDYANLEIIVSDNNSQDDTAEVVKSFQDPRIKYYHTGQPLSMTSNWEFALDKAGEGFVTFLGDDDGLMPDALKKANHYINDYKAEAIVGRKDLYKWNDIAEHSQQGLLRYEVKKKTEWRNSRKMLNEVLNHSFDYYKLPCLYSVGFISMNVVRKIKAESKGVFFHSSIPDVYSSLIIALNLEKYLFVNETFLLSGISAFSNGNSSFNPDADKQIIKSFLAENKIPFHKDLVFSASTPVTLAESLFQIRDLGFVKEGEFGYDIKHIAKLAMKEASCMKFEKPYKEVLASLEEITRKNGIDASYMKMLEKKFPYKDSFTRNLIALKEVFAPSKAKNILYIKSRAANIYDAVHINNTMKKNSFLQNNPAVILAKWILFKLK